MTSQMGQWWRRLGTNGLSVGRPRLVAYAILFLTFTLFACSKRQEPAAGASHTIRGGIAVATGLNYEACPFNGGEIVEVRDEHETLIGKAPIRSLRVLPRGNPTTCVARFRVKVPTAQIYRFSVGGIEVPRVYTYDEMAKTWNWQEVGLLIG